MALTKINGDVIEANAISSTHLASGAVTHSSLSSITTDNVSEGSTNLYHSAARARSALSVTGGGISYDSGTGVIQIASIPNASLANSSVTINSNSVSLGSSVTLDTDNIGEGSTNLYFTNERVDDRVASLLTAGTGITLTYNDVANTLTIAGSAQYGDSDVESYLSGGTGVTFSSGVISIGQDVGTSSTPTFGNITTTGYLAGPATFTIDPAAVGDNTGTVVIAGNLQVDGTTTTINSTTVNIDDLNIQLATGAANAAAANGAGITVDGASATFTYNSGNDDWNINRTLRVENNGSLLRKYVSAWSYPIHDIIYSSYLANTGDYTYLKAAGNSAGPHGAIITGDSVFAVGTTDVELGGMVNSATAPLTNTWLYANSSGLNINGTLTTTGNVGIGTSSPSEQLHISNANDAVVLIESTGIDSTDDANVQLKTTNGTFTIQNDRSLGTSGALTFAGNTSNNLVIDHNAGNVGIGTNSPEKIFHIKTAVNNTAFARIESTAANSYPTLSIKNDVREYQLTTHGGVSDSFVIYDGTAGANRLVIDTSGNVLVGTTNSDIGGSVTGVRLAQSGAIYASTDETTNLFSQPLYADRRGTNNTGDILALALNGYLKSTIGVIGTSGTSDDGGITFNTVASNATKTERMRIDPSNLLINGTSRANGYPSRFLTLSMQPDLSQESCPILELVGNRTANSGNQNGMIQFYNKTSTAVEVGRISSIQGSATNSGAFTFQVANAGTLSEAMRIDSSGNVGIGAAPTGVTGLGVNKFFEMGGATVPGIVFRPSGTTVENSVASANDGLLLTATGAATASNNVIRLFTTNTNSSNSPLERMRIDSSGRVLVGITGASGFGQLETTTFATEGQCILARTSGNVGIGTTSPGAPLDLQTAGNTADGTYYSTFTINNTGTSTWSRIRFDRSGVARWGISLGTDDKFKISNLFTGGTVASPDDQVLVIDNNSNIGIGTSNPDHKFHVDVGAPSSADKTLAAFSSERTLRDIGFVWDDSASTLGVATLTNHHMAFHTNGNSSERMRITNGGQVLINAINPNYPTDYATNGTVATTIIRGPEVAATDNALFVYGGRIVLNAHPARYSSRGWIQCWGGGFEIHHADNSDMIFYTNGTENMRIKWSTGRINSLATYNNAAPATNRDVYVENNGDLGYASSVRAHKTNITNYGDASWLYNLDPVTFNYRKPNTTTITNEDGHSTEVNDGTYSDTEYFDTVNVGFIAEDVEQYDPNLCFYNEVEDEDGNVNYELAGIHYKSMVAPLLKLIQEQKALIDDLQARVTTLEG